MYFRIKQSLDLTIIGKYPLVEEGIHPVGIDHPNLIDKIFFEKSRFSPIVPLAKLANGAKYTDLMSNSVFGLGLKLLVSDRLKTIIESFKHNGCEFFKTKVERGLVSERYWIMSAYEMDYESLDLEGSKFMLMKDIFQEVKEIHFNSSSDLFKWREIIANQYGQEFTFKIKKLAFNTTSQNIVFLNPVTGGIGYFVSDKVKSQMEQNGCTGLDFVMV